MSRFISVILIGLFLCVNANAISQSEATKSENKYCKIIYQYKIKPFNQEYWATYEKFVLIRKVTPNKVFFTEIKENCLYWISLKDVFDIKILNAQDRRI